MNSSVFNRNSIFTEPLLNEPGKRRNKMNRREFLKGALTLAALAPITRLAAKAGADGDKTSDVRQGSQVTRRRYKNSALTVPLLGFGCMRLPQVSPDNPKIDYATAKEDDRPCNESGMQLFRHRLHVSRRRKRTLSRGTAETLLPRLLLAIRN